MNWTRDDVVLTNEPTPSCADDTYRLLQETYWSHKRPLPLVKKLLENSLCFFLLQGDTQVGFARIISDFATTSWLADVVLAEHLQNKGIGSWMMQCVMEHPEIRETQFVLQTGTASEFYERLGFQKSPALMSTPVDYL